MAVEQTLLVEEVLSLKRCADGNGLVVGTPWWWVVQNVHPDMTGRVLCMFLWMHRHCRAHFLWRVAPHYIVDDGMVFLSDLGGGGGRDDGKSIHPTIIDLGSPWSCIFCGRKTLLSSSISMADGDVLRWWWWYVFSFWFRWRWREGWFQIRPSIYHWYRLPLISSFFFQSQNAAVELNLRCVGDDYTVFLLIDLGGGENLQIKSKMSTICSWCGLGTKRALNTQPPSWICSIFTS